MTIEAFFDAPAHVQAHALCALAAVGVGAVQFLAPKGTVPHRTLGIVFLALMGAVAISAYFIRTSASGAMSPIHLFIPLTLFGIVVGYLTARARRALHHRRAMLGLYFGALLIPGAFTLLPGRLMHAVVFG